MSSTLTAVQTNNTIVTDSAEYLSGIPSLPEPVIVERVTFYAFIKETPELDDLLRLKYRILGRKGETTMGTGTGNAFTLYLTEVERIRAIQRRLVKSKGLLLLLSFDPSSWRIRGDTGSPKVTTDVVIESAMQELESYVLSDLLNTEGEVLSATDFRLKHLILRKNAYLRSTISMTEKYAFEPVFESLKELPKHLKRKIVVALENASQNRPFLGNFRYGREYLDADLENISEQAQIMCGCICGSVAWKIDFYQFINNAAGAHYEKFDRLQAEVGFVTDETSWDASIIPELIKDFETI